MADILKKWSLSNIPPEGHEDVGKFAWELFELSKEEKDRLLLPDRWRENYRSYRGDLWGKQPRRASRSTNRVNVNLFFANVNRTVANVVAKNPVAEVVDMDGVGDGGDQVLTARTKKWWKETGQRKKLRTSALKMEKYGITTEKAFWDHRRNRPDTIVVDPFSYFPAPGYYDNPPADMPYCCHAYPEDIDGVKAMFGTTEDVQPDEVYSLLGEDRDALRPDVTSGTRGGSVNASGNYSGVTMHPSAKDSNIRQGKALVVEVWVRDFSTKTEAEVVGQQVVGADEMGEPVYKDVVEKREVPVYPGGIRKITVTNQGMLVLDDVPNPNINLMFPEEVLQECYLYSHLPFYMANSYEDTTSNWGFSAAEQTEDLSRKVSEIVSQLITYVQRSMTGILVVPQSTGITRDMINNRPNLVLQPKNAESANGIKVIAMPNLSAKFFDALNLLMSLFDRVYQIEDADRGLAPSGVKAASAIVALQERNAVLIQHKISAIDMLVEARGKCAISLWQCHGHQQEAIEVAGDTRQFTGVGFAGRRFAYVVESGSTMPKTSLQVEAQAVDLYQAQAIDRQALLEALNFPGTKEILERTGEGMLNQALQVLVQAGLPEQNALELRNLLMEPQGGPGNRPQGQTSQGRRTAAVA